MHKGEHLLKYYHDCVSIASVSPQPCSRTKYLSLTGKEGELQLFFKNQRYNPALFFSAIVVM